MIQVGCLVVPATCQKTKPGKDNHAGQAYSPVRPAPAVTAVRIQCHVTVQLRGYAALLCNMPPCAVPLRAPPRCCTALPPRIVMLH